MLRAPARGLTEKHGKTYFLTIYTYSALKWAKMMISSEKRGKKFQTISFVNRKTWQNIFSYYLHIFGLKMGQDDDFKRKTREKISDHFIC